MYRSPSSSLARLTRSFNVPDPTATGTIPRSPFPIPRSPLIASRTSSTFAYVAWKSDPSGFTTYSETSTPASLRRDATLSPATDFVRGSSTRIAFTSDGNSLRNISAAPSAAPGPTTHAFVSAAFARASAIISTYLPCSTCHGSRAPAEVQRVQADRPWRSCRSRASISCAGPPCSRPRSM